MFHVIADTMLVATRLEENGWSHEDAARPGSRNGGKARCGWQVRHRANDSKRL